MERQMDGWIERNIVGIIKKYRQTDAWNEKFWNKTERQIDKSTAEPRNNFCLDCPQ